MLEMYWNNWLYCTDINLEQTKINGNNNNNNNNKALALHQIQSMCHGTWFIIRDIIRHYHLLKDHLPSSWNIWKLNKENSDELDILEWWKNKQGCFLTLSLISGDIFATLVASVASMQGFSAINHVLDERRSTMCLDILEGLMYLKDWEDARRWKQNSDEDSIAAYYALLHSEASTSSSSHV